MPLIDADAHVIENEKTWSYFRPEEMAFKPRALLSADEGIGGLMQQQNANQGAVRSGRQLYWLYDGKYLSVRGGMNIEGLYPQGSVDLTNIPSRIEHLDRLDIAVQVLMPSIFINGAFTRPEAEYAIARSYNRWMADMHAEAPDRLRWACPIAPMSLDKSIEEMEFAKDHGAVSVFMRGLERNRRLSDRYFYPIWEAAERLDMVISIHIGAGGFDGLRDVGGTLQAAPLIDACKAIGTSEVPEKFPTLRWAFLESGSAWVPHILRDAARGGQTGFRKDGLGSVGAQWIKDRRFHFACWVDEDLPYVIDRIGDDCLLCATDYGHADIGTDLEGVRLLKERGDLPAATVEKITYKNAEKLYKLKTPTKVAA